MSTPSKAPTVPDATTVRGLVTDTCQGWDRFWFSAVDPATLCMIRLCAGLLAFYVLLTYTWNLFAYVGPQGWVDAPVATYLLQDIPVWQMKTDWDNNYEPTGQTGNYYFSVYYHVTRFEWIVAFHAAFLVSALMFATGLWTRVTGMITWLGMMSYANRAGTTVFGMDTMLMITLCYLQIGPAGAALSLDRWLQKRRARKRGEPEPVVQPSRSANFAIRLIQFHFCVIYLAGGTTKLLGSMWWSGTALNVVLLNPSFAPMDSGLYFGFMKFMATHRWLWELFMGGGILFTLGLEVGFIYLVWDRRWRWLMVCGSVMLHVGIGYIMGLTTFSMIMMIMVSSFFPPEVVRAFLTTAQRRLRQSFADLEAGEKAPAESRELVMTR